jgi:hypothetical protein
VGSLICTLVEPMSVKFTIRTRSQTRQEEIADESGSSSSEHSQLAQQTGVEWPSPIEDGRQEITEEEEESSSSEPPENAEDEMTEPRVIITPGRFRGGIEENVMDYIAQFERVARANGWNDAKKLVVIPCYLDGAALKWHENTDKAEGEALTWEVLKTKMKGEFEGVAWDEQLEFKLRMRMQGEDEPVESYVQDVMNLCSED